MPRKSKPAPGLPSREQVLDFIKTSEGKVGKREIARAFGLKGSDKIALKALLKDLAEDGAIARRGKRLARPGLLPPVTVVDITGRDRDGDLIARPNDWLVEDMGPVPRIVIKADRRGKTVGGVGDRVLARLEELPERGRDGEALYTARIIRKLAKSTERVLGIFRALPGGRGRIEPVDRKAMREFTVEADETAEAQPGDIVSLDVTERGRHGVPKARIIDVHGPAGSEKTISRIAIEAHGIPTEFPSEALSEADKAKAPSPGRREDLRKLPLITIDPVDARDHDDAVHAEEDPDPANKGGIIVTVAIADVAYYVRHGMAMDKTARERGNSVYFPDRVVPMLPERISNDLCSLRPAEDRPALVVRMVFGANGRKKNHRFMRAMIHSAAKLSYTQAQTAIDGNPDDTTKPLLEPVLKPLWRAYDLLAKARDARQPLDLDLPERKVILKKNGAIDRIVVPPRLDAHRLIEEFMIQANVAAAETLEAKKSPLLYRVHEAPSKVKLDALITFLNTLGIKLAKGMTLKPADFNRILDRVEGGEFDAMVNEMVLRSQSQAIYSPANLGHFGLNLRRYAHFTSPIRRYADLIVHRGLIRSLGLGDDGLTDATIEELDDIAAEISAAERRAMAAERDTIDRLVAHFLAGKVGAAFHGRISGVVKVGLFVKLTETGADGFIPASTLGDDFFRYDEARQAMIGSRTGEMHRIGDDVEVKLVEATPIAGALRFEMLSEGRYVGAGGTGKSRQDKGATKPARRTASRKKPAKPRRGKRDDR